MEKINIEEYNYDLPEERIAQYPVPERDMSNLLVFREGKISKDIFRNLDQYIPKESLLVFNNTRVIRARLLFRKESGAAIEVLCLEPLNPSDYALSLGSAEAVEWKCIVGNLKKWKTGRLILPFYRNEKPYNLTAEKIASEGDAWRVKFSWDSGELSFGEVIESAGHIPLPPYLNREDGSVDYIRYQTVYSSVKGSVAAPTAGLHFTENVFKKLNKEGIKTSELTLHVGAGTFKPIKSRNISEHNMHNEHFFVTADTIKMLIKNLGQIIPVGTTSVRTLETLYWLGVQIAGKNTDISYPLTLGQWDAYNLDSSLSAGDALKAILRMMNQRETLILEASTRIMIIPGYNFKMINGIITNFHQPKSTLLLLISAWIGENWKEVYKFAMDNNFRFLSYGDSSVLLR
jgi:S-adenosylmethionine:tRNA ribosyltransferase-isomerase